MPEFQSREPRGSFGSDRDRDRAGIGLVGARPAQRTDPVEQTSRRPEPQSYMDSLSAAAQRAVTEPGWGQKFYSGRETQDIGPSNFAGRPLADTTYAANQTSPEDVDRLGNMLAGQLSSPDQFPGEEVGMTPEAQEKLEGRTFGWNPNTDEGFSQTGGQQFGSFLASMLAPGFNIDVSTNELTDKSQIDSEFSIGNLIGSVLGGGVGSFVGGPIGQLLGSTVGTEIADATGYGFNNPLGFNRFDPFDDLGGAVSDLFDDNFSAGTNDISGLREGPGRRELPSAPLGADIGLAPPPVAPQGPSDAQLTDFLQQGFRSQLGSIFPGNAFELDQFLIDAIVNERLGPAQEQVALAGGSGNLNEAGSSIANQILQQQLEAAGQSVSDIGGGVISGFQGNVNEILGRAEEQISGFKLGDPFFDPSPFAAEREALISELSGTLGTDIRTALGSDPLFDVSEALRLAGGGQGLVPGPSSQTLLDVLASNISGATPITRSIPSSGSGIF